MKKYLVLGGNGFIGKNLCNYIAETGAEVTSFDREIADYDCSRIHSVEGNFFDDDSLKKILLDHDVIYHAISTINPGNSNEKYMQGYQNDLVQTVKICSWLQNTPKTLVFLSSGGTVYGNQMCQPITEEMLPQPINHYGNIKLCIENVLRIFHIQNTLNIRIARIANPFGPGQDYTKGVGFVDAVLKRAMENKTIEIWGDGENIRDYIYIKDVCYYLYKLGEYQGDDLIFNISSGRGISQNQVIDIIRSLVKDIQIDVEYKGQRSVDARKMILDNQKILKACGGTITSFEDGLQLYYNYLTSN